MLGADIYDRYQDVTDWAALARAVDWLWVKATDGGGRAPVRADRFVRAARDAGIPVGLYHYAQLSPSPEAQADVLAAEVRRLGADQVVPALDIEDPHQPGPAAREFSRRFLRRLTDHHRFARVAIYGNSSMFAAIRPDTVDVPGLVIWVADYGRNDGRRNPDLRPYTGRVDVHQYTSRGRVDGIPGHVDLNHAHTTRHLSEEDMLSALTAEEQRELYVFVDAIRKGLFYGFTRFGINHPPILDIIRENQARITRGHAELIAAVTRDPAITPDSVAALIDESVARHTPTAEQNRAALLPVVEDIARRVAGADNTALVDNILAELGRALIEDQEPEEAPA